MKRLFAALALVALAACNPTTTATPDYGPQISAKINEQETAMNAALAAEDITTIVGFYAPDAQLFDPMAAAATTPEAIRHEFEGLFSDPNGALSFTTSDVVIPSSGDYAISQGTLRVTYTDPATHHAVTQTGNYVTLWRKQDDDGWKIIRDISTPDAGH